jgi:hypothetical protein
MTFVRHLNLLTLDVLKVLSMGLCEKTFYLLIQQTLILFEGEGIVAILLDNLFGDQLLRPHRINGHNAA